MILYNNTIVQEDLKNICERVELYEFEGKNILITGANGHIATYIAYTLLYAHEKHILVGTQIYVLSRNASMLSQLYGIFRDIPCFHMIVGDVAEFEQVEIRFDYIFHFAGNASPYYIMNDPVGILKANITGTLNVAELAIKAPGSKIIYSSTREVYGANDKDNVLDEKAFGVIDPLDLRSCYPESKRAAETILASYYTQYGLLYVIARIAHCYGPGMKLTNDGRVMSDFVNFAINHKDIVLNSNGKALRSFCYITDVVVALLMMATNKSGPCAYNLANESDELSIKELAEYIAEMVGDIKVRFNFTSIDSSVYCAYKRKPLDCTRLKEIGWQPEVDIRNGVERTVRSFLQNKGLE